MNGKAKQNKDRFMIKLSTFIVDKRNLIFLIFIGMAIFSLVARNWVVVENDLTAYLPEDSETRQSLDIMDKEFTTFGTADVMVANISLGDAETLKDTLKNVDGVQSVGFDDSKDHYNNVSALYNITFDYDENNEKCVDSLERVKETLSGYDYYVSTNLGNALADIISQEVQFIMVLVAGVILLVLLFTSKTYAEIPVLIITFIAGMIVNIGSSFLMGKISFISNSVTSILQLALSIDYAIIFCNHYKEEHNLLPIREAVIIALSKSIPEITASSMTTIGGLVAMMFMNFKIGADMGINLIKAILFALLSAFLLMPGLLMVFGPLIDRTGHRSFIKKIDFVGKFDYASRRVVPIIFVVVLIGAMVISQFCPYAYGENGIETPKKNDTQIAQEMIDDNFSGKNMVALIVPSGSYENEKSLIKELVSMNEVDSCTGLANVEALDGYTLTDKITPRQFAESTDMDYEVGVILYTAYAAEHENYGKIVGGISTYSVPVIDIFMFACDEIHNGYITLDSDKMEKLDEAYNQMKNAKVQLHGKNFDRILVYLNLTESGDATFAFLDKMQETAQSYYPDGEVHIAGNSTNQYDFKKTFSRDNIVVSVLSIIIVLVVLLFTFKSVGMPILLIMVIQGSIWLNFTIPALTGSPLMFMSYLVVSSIQMGANIDYAIVIASRYTQLRETMPKKEAIVETMNFAFPTVITSGSILAISGILIGHLTSNVAIVGIGQSLGRGTIISMILVMFVLPQILLIGEKIISKTSFSVHHHIKRKETSEKIVIDGKIDETVNGRIKGTVHGVVDGDIDVKFITGSVQEENSYENDDKE